MTTAYFRLCDSNPGFNFIPLHPALLGVVPSLRQKIAYSLQHTSLGGVIFYILEYIIYKIYILDICLNL